MELEFTRNDLVTTTTTSQGTLSVLPPGANKQQKIATGDTAGVVQVFSIKKGEVDYAFKGLPTQKKVTTLGIGKSRNQRDKVFYAMGNVIVGITKKGREFFRFSTNLTEPIWRMAVAESHIYTAGEYVSNHFLESKDKDLYLSPDRINDAEVVPLLNLTELNPALACQDRFIRVLSGSTLYYEAAVPSPPMCLKFIPESHDTGNRFPGARELLVGLENGTLAQWLLDPEAIRQGFQLDNPKKLSAVKAVFSGADYTRSGINDILIGRDDGSIEMYDVDEAGELQQVFTTKLGESINTLDGGYITSPALQDFVVQTFSGKTIAYCPPGSGLIIPLEQPVGPIRKGRVILSEEVVTMKSSLETRIAKLRQELADLDQRLGEERVRYASITESMVAASSMFEVHHTFRLEADDACYNLSIESAVPIFTLALQSSLDLSLLDVPSNVAILSMSPPDEANGNLTLATYRCQENTTRLSIKFKVQEGQPGVVSAFVIPHISPKTVSMINNKIKPLCLHHRTSVIDEDLPMNELNVTGTFGLADMHNWLAAALMDMPPQPVPVNDRATLLFSNVLTGTQLCCIYTANEARFTSDSLSTLSMLRECIMREATMSRGRVNVTFKVNPACVQHFLTQLWPKLEHQRTMSRRKQMIDGLQELRQQYDNLDFLAPSMREVLENADSIVAESKEESRVLEHLMSLVKDLYVDFCRLNNVSTPKQRLPQLEAMLKDSNSTYEQVQDFILGKNSSS